MTATAASGREPFTRVLSDAVIARTLPKCFFEGRLF
jgi:hypothetical protein